MSERYIAVKNGKIRGILDSDSATASFRSDDMDVQVAVYHEHRSDIRDGALEYLRKHPDFREDIDWSWSRLSEWKSDELVIEPPGKFSFLLG